MSDGTAAATATTATTTTTAAAATAAATNWYDGAEPETIGLLQTRGWDKLDPSKAALAAAKSYREAEKHIGAPPDQILRLPKDINDKEGWAKLHERLGVPADPNLYNFDDVKFSDKSDLDKSIVDGLRSAASEAKLTPDAAKSVARAVVKMMEQAEQGEAAEYEAKLAVERDTLKKNWGMNANAFKVVAENAAQKLGVTADELSALEKTVGYSRVMEMFRNIGQRIGEDKFITSGPSGGGGPMTVEQAKATIDSRMADVAWVEKFTNGDAAAKQEFHNLTRIASGQF